MSKLASRYFVAEPRKFSYWEFEAGECVCKYTTDTLAIAFDGDNLTFRKIGPITEVLKWATEERDRLKDLGELVRSKNLTSLQIHRSHPIEELNRLVEDPAYLTKFLQKAGIV